MAGSTDAAQLFWGSFLELSTAGPDLLRVVCNHLSRYERQVLRGVDRAMRRAMNTTVTHVTCPVTTLPAQDLLEVFPNATYLKLTVFGAIDSCALLEWMVSGSARLLASLHHLSIDIDAEAIEAAEVIPAMLNLISR
jgi:hypothetical protein